MPEKIMIPQKLETQLLRNDTYFACVVKLCNNVSSYLDMSPVFFPNYTIHSLDHINEVLNLASDLITDGSFSSGPKAAANKGLSPRDIAYLVAAILIHDLGMFLKPAGVKAMIAGNWGAEGIRCLDDKTWKEEWDAYISRAKRYSPEKKTVLFGSDITIDAGCVGKQVYNDNDYLVIGEFLRQHHPRLAYEIAVSDMPGSTGEDIFKETGFSPADRKLIGLLARSHGMGLRNMEESVKTLIGSGSKPRNIPVFFLMAVLRIADYLDAGKHRAPVCREHLQEIRVAISKDEWNWNQCIDRDDCQWELEQKNRKIQAYPENSIQYVQLEKWLNSVQEELDICWAVLAEKYPSEPCRLSIHRLTSNIYEDTYETFLPREARLSANPKILPQLIAPLYGDNPSFGIRELVQNAVDACIEREYFEQNHPQGDKNYSGHVKVEIDTKTKTFTITDNGIGMDENVLLNYYLSAGASYRSSEEWKEAFAKDNVPQIARTGKFGIGFLAGFLLGDTITVTTRHRKEDRGYKFSFTTQSKPLCVERVSTPTWGTTISIKMKEGALEKLVEQRETTTFQSDRYVTAWYCWYAFNDPVVEYYLDGAQLYHEGITLSRDPEKNTGWFSLESDIYKPYLWRVPKGNRHGQFYCNGIRIHNTPLANTSYFGMHISSPDIAIQDHNAMLSVDLSRSRIEELPEFQELVRQNYHLIIARLLLTTWNFNQFSEKLVSGFSPSQSRWASPIPYLVSAHGFSLNCRAALAATGIRRYMALFFNGGYCDNALEAAHRFLPADMPLTIVHSADDIRQEHLEPHIFLPSNRPFENFCNTFASSAHSEFDMQYSPKSSVVNTWVHSKDAAFIMEHIIRALPPEVQVAEDRVYRWDKSGFVDTPEDPAVFDEAAFLQEAFPIALEIRLPEGGPWITEYLNPDIPVSFFSRIFRELLTPDPGYPRQDMWIPFDMAERKKKFPKAFEALDYYIQKLSDE